MQRHQMKGNYSTHAREIEFTRTARVAEGKQKLYTVSALDNDLVVLEHIVNKIHEVKGEHEEIDRKGVALRRPRPSGPSVLTHQDGTGR